MPAIAPVGSFDLEFDLGGPGNVLVESRKMETMLVFPIGSAVWTAWCTENVCRS